MRTFTLYNLYILQIQIRKMTKKCECALVIYPLYCPHPDFVFKQIEHSYIIKNISSQPQKAFANINNLNLIVETISSV